MGKGLSSTVYGKAIEHPVLYAVYASIKAQQPIPTPGLLISPTHPLPAPIFNGTQRSVHCVHRVHLVLHVSDTVPGGSGCVRASPGPPDESFPGSP